MKGTKKFFVLHSIFVRIQYILTNQNAKNSTKHTKCHIM